MRTVILTIIVAMLATACSGAKSNRGTVGHSASFLELIEATDQQVMLDGEHPPEEVTTPEEPEPQPQDADSNVGEIDEELELLLKEPTEGGNPQYAERDVAGETGAPKVDIGTTQYAEEFGWLNESSDDIDSWGVIGC